MLFNTWFGSAGVQRLSSGRVPPAKRWACVGRNPRVIQRGYVGRVHGETCEWYAAIRILSVFIFSFLFLFLFCFIKGITKGRVPWFARGCENPLFNAFIIEKSNLSRSLKCLIKFWFFFDFVFMETQIETVFRVIVNNYEQVIKLFDSIKNLITVVSNLSVPT